MGVKGGGCSGLSYALEFHSEKGPHDKEFDIDGIKVVVDKKSYLYLNGTTLDYVQQGLTGGFTFVNPKPEEFPERISYRRATEGWLYASVEGKVKGAERKATYPMRRINCESGEFITR